MQASVVMVLCLGVLLGMDIGEETALPTGAKAPSLRLSNGGFCVGVWRTILGVKLLRALVHMDGEAGIIPVSPPELSLCGTHQPCNYLWSICLFLWAAHALTLSWPCSWLGLQQRAACPGRHKRLLGKQTSGAWLG